MSALDDVRAIVATLRGLGDKPLWWDEADGAPPDASYAVIARDLAAAWQASTRELANTYGLARVGIVAGRKASRVADDLDALVREAERAGSAIAPEPAKDESMGGLLWAFGLAVLLAIVVSR